jgi:RHS repeat-associated protein
MPALAQSFDEDLQNRAANDDDINGGSGTRTKYAYDPYGNRTTISGTVVSDIGYAGYFYHAGSGLEFAMHRAYDSEHARWLNRDPIGEDGGLNLYEYASDNPISNIDPSGLDWHIRGTPTNNGLQNMPDNGCDLPIFGTSNCISQDRLCTKARCKGGVDKCGKTWYYIVTEWLPSRPTPAEVHKVAPNCECIDWEFRSGG